MNNDGAVFALATPPGRSAIALIRLTGPATLEKLTPFFRPFTQTAITADKNRRRAIYGRLLDDENRVIDEIILIPFRENASYTGEESAELHLHGNPVIIRRAARLLLHAGFERAAPGEFTRRAYLNGRMNLTEAEAVREIIEARSEKALQSAMVMKQGHFRKILLRFRADLLNLTADLTAELDFVDEDITFVEHDNKIRLIKSLITEVKDLLRDSESMQIYRDGAVITIAGAPNAGKSSLLNLLSGSDRAIVSETAGTTRDYIESDLLLEGIPVRMIDTAGIRDITRDTIEAQGIEQSRRLVAEADLVLLLIDCALPPERAVKESPLALINEKHLEEKTICLLNKNDIAAEGWQSFNAELPAAAVIEFSVTREQGLDALREHAIRLLERNTTGSTGLILSEWQSDLLGQILSELNEAVQLVEAETSPELPVQNLQNSIDLIAELTGEITSEDLLGRIFSRFCIGK